MIFLDSGYFIGLMDKKDDNHEDAIKIENYLNYADESTVVNTTVLVETLNRSVGKKDDVKQLWDDLHVNNIVIQLSDEDYLKSLEINGWFNNSINYSDCTIIQTMMSMGINRIVSFDGGFKKIGKYDVISAIGWDNMLVDYEIKNEKLKKMLEKKAQELHISLNRLMWNYINRGLMGDNVDEEKFRKYHSEEYLKEVNEALGLD